MITNTLALRLKYEPDRNGETLLRETLTPSWGEHPITFRRNNESKRTIDIILSRLAVDDSNVRIIVGFALDSVDRVLHRAESRVPRQTVHVARQFLSGTASVDKLWPALVALVDAASEADAARAAAWTAFESVERHGRAAVAVAKDTLAQAEAIADTIYASSRRASLPAYIWAAIGNTQSPYDKSVAATIACNDAAGALNEAKYKADADRKDASAAYERAQAVANITEAAADALAAAYAITTDIETAAEYVCFAAKGAAMGAADYDDERSWQGQRLFELINGFVQ